MCHCVARYLRRISGFHNWNGKPFGTHLKRNDQNFFFPLPVHKKQATNYHSQLSPVLTAIGWDIELQSADLCYQITSPGRGEQVRANEAWWRKGRLVRIEKWKLACNALKVNEAFGWGVWENEKIQLRATVEWNKLSWSYDLALPTYPTMVINWCVRSSFSCSRYLHQNAPNRRESRWRWCVMCLASITLFDYGGWWVL